MHPRYTLPALAEVRVQQDTRVTQTVTSGLAVTWLAPETLAKPGRSEPAGGSDLW